MVRVKGSTYGQDITETILIPIMIAALTLYAMRYAVRMPPNATAIHN